MRRCLHCAIAGISSLWNTTKQIEALISTSEGNYYYQFHSKFCYITAHVERIHISRGCYIRERIFLQAAYKVGAHSINAQTIEHSILGCRSIRPSQVNAQNRHFYPLWITFHIVYANPGIAKISPTRQVGVFFFGILHRKKNCRADMLFIHVAKMNGNSSGMDLHVVDGMF